ncbi:DUF433 domain-containing protein [candidate division GN15 bacterium]|nr:DUF433 domain-containing protein [candidate division GN15 bacterium]
MGNGRGLVKTRVKGGDMGEATQAEGGSAEVRGAPPGNGATPGLRASVVIRDTDVTVPDVLRLIARGFSYPQILQTHPSLIQADIQASARLALTIMDQYVTAESTIALDHVIEITATNKRIVNLSKVREEFPRAFMPWKTTEDTRLIEAFRAGMSIDALAKSHQRRPTAIQARLASLGLVKTSGRREEP